MRHHSLAGSIAFAESVSTVTSFGSVWLITTQKNIAGTIVPVKDFLARKVIYPMISGNAYPENDVSADKQLIEKAHRKASVLLKGIIMTGADFTTTVASQMAAEGEFSKKEFHKAAKGKAFGLGTTLITLEILNRVMPGMMEKVENRIIQHLPQCCKKEAGDGSDMQRELAKLAIIAVPSSIISGIVSYMTQSRYISR